MSLRAAPRLWSRDPSPTSSPPSHPPTHLPSPPPHFYALNLSAPPSLQPKGKAHICPPFSFRSACSSGQTRAPPTRVARWHKSWLNIGTRVHATLFYLDPRESNQVQLDIISVFGRGTPTFIIYWQVFLVRMTRKRLDLVFWWPDQTHALPPSSTTCAPAGQPPITKTCLNPDKPAKPWTLKYQILLRSNIDPQISSSGKILTFDDQPETKYGGSQI